MKKAPYSLTIIATLGLVTASLFSQQTAIPEIAELQSKYDERVTLDVLRPHYLAVADLNTKFASALERAQEATQRAGSLEEALAIKTEKEAVLSGKYSPSADDAKTSASLKTLRSTYRNALARLELDRDKKLRPLKEVYAKSLDAVILTMTKSGKLEQAMVLKKMREDLLANTVATGADAGTGANAIHGPGGKPFTNSLGMKFVPVADTNVLFCIHETRYKDYAVYAAEESGVDGTWKVQSANGFTPVGNLEDHPAVSISWEDAQKFCAWLSKKEGRKYRLPTDREWSIAVGIGRDEKWAKDTTPEMLTQKVQDKWPWGTNWPPPKDAGNYADLSRKSTFPAERFIEGYDDGFPTTAPVMSFKPNMLGLYDLGGNVWEWCEDLHNATKADRVMRGGSWNLSGESPLLSSCRGSNTPGSRYNHFGFRVVVEPVP